MAELQDQLAERVELAIGGAVYGGWTDVAIELSLQKMSGSFSLSLAPMPETGAAEVKVEPGDRCEVRIGGEVVINGWIDLVEASFDDQSHSLTVAGRDRAGDLLDCSAVGKPRTWSNVKLEAIASELVKPFGLTVTAKADTGAAIKKFALAPSETIGAAIERLLRFRGLLAVPTVDGNLEIVTPDEGAPIDTIRDGERIKSGAGKRDHSERFSDYIVKGQSSGNDQHNGKAVSQIKGEAKDVGVRRYRPMIVVAEEQSDGATALTRAKWEAGVRAGRSVEGRFEVVGWRAAGGPIWRPNRRLRVQSKLARLPDEMMLITDVRLSRSNDGTVASLTVAPPEALKQLAEPEGKT